MKYRKISPRIWNDAKFRTLSDNGKLAFFMLLTHPHTSAIGTMRAYIQGLAAEMVWTEKAFREAFCEALNKGMVKVSERDGLIWLPQFMKYNAPESPNVLKSWSGALEDCPECQLKNEVFHTIKAFAESLGKAFDKAFSEAFKLPLPNQEQEQEQEHNTPLTPQGGNDCSVSPTQDRRIKKPTTYSPDFERFWSEYPRRTGKDAAWKVYQRRKHEVPKGDAMSVILERHRQTDQWQREGGQYIPHPATWLNQGRWEDDLSSTGTTQYPEGW